MKFHKNVLNVFYTSDYLYYWFSTFVGFLFLFHPLCICACVKLLLFIIHIIISYM